MDKPDLELKDIGQYYGTEFYHSIMLGVKATDGVEYIMRNGYSWLVTDAIVVAKMKLQKEEFLVVTLKLLKEGDADMIITDGNEHELYKQHYNYTNAKREITFYITDNIVLLPSEN